MEEKDERERIIPAEESKQFSISSESGDSTALKVKFFFMFLCYCMFVFCRRFPLLVIADIRKDVDITDDDIGVLLSVQSICFTVSKLLFGMRVDSGSPPRILAAALVGISASTLLLSWVASKPLLFLSVAANQILQGAGWAACVKLLQKWLRGSDSYAVWFTCLSTGSSVAGMGLPLATLAHWRPTAFAIGCVGVSSAVAFYWLAGGDGAVEKEKEEEGGEGGGEKQDSMWAVRKGAVWHVAGLYAFTMQARAVCESWLPLYLSSHGAAASFAFAFEFGGLCGSVLSGWAIEVLTRRLGAGGAQRRVAVLCTAAQLVAIAAAFRYAPYSAPLGCLAGGLVYASINVWSMISAGMAPAHCSGMVNAIVSFTSNLGAVAAGWPVGVLVASAGYAPIQTLFVTEMVVVLAIWALNLDIHINKKKVE